MGNDVDTLYEERKYLVGFNFIRVYTACSLVDFQADKSGWCWFVVREKHCWPTDKIWLKSTSEHAKNINAKRIYTSQKYYCKTCLNSMSKILLCNMFGLTVAQQEYMRGPIIEFEPIYKYILFLYLKNVYDIYELIYRELN